METRSRGCTCRIRTVRHLLPSPHLCAMSCRRMDHVASEINHQTALRQQTWPVQLRLF